MLSSEVHGTRCRKPNGPDTARHGVEAGIYADLFHSLLTKSIWSSPVAPERGDGPAGLRKERHEEHWKNSHPLPPRSTSVSSEVSLKVTLVRSWCLGRGHCEDIPN